MFPDRLCCFFAGIFIMLGVSCSHKRVVVPTYYYWRTETWVSQEEKGLLRKHAIPVLYTKVLDVDWAGVSGAIPVAGLDVNDINQHLNGYDSLRIQIVPVVFITNKTFSSIDSAEVPLLAKRVLRRCLPAYDSLDVAYEGRRVIESRLPARPREIQFDCDWTTKTAAKYFYFLQQVRQLLPSDSIRLSATIRLHQFKYPDKTGTPPVDRGMLMVYNVGDLKQYSPVNSIFEWKKAAAYFTGGKEYSLPLDIALPAYSWGLVFRDKKFYQIENGLDAGELNSNEAFVKEEGAADNGVSFYRVKKEIVMGELFLRPGDEIKIESIDSALLASAARLSQRAVNTDTFRVALFELSTKEIKRFSDESLAHIYHSYQ